MTQRPEGPSVPPAPHGAQGDVPPPDVVAFIRHCHARRAAGWPELYDEMCAVAAHREFRGWGHDELAARGLTFSLGQMPRLAGWVRAVLAADARASRRVAAVAGSDERVIGTTGERSAQPAGA